MKERRFRASQKLGAFKVMGQIEEFDLFVIGGGSGGVRGSRIAAKHGAKVAIAEEYRYGGTCVIRGCVPKKLLVYAAKFASSFKDSKGYGWTGENTFDWPTLLANKNKEIDRLNAIYARILGEAGVTVLNGRAVLLDKNTVQVGDKTYKAKKILIATGGTPKKMDVPGKELCITSNEALELAELPKSITIVGGGYIGLEFAGIFKGLGAKVTIVHHRDKVLRGFDEDVRDAVMEHARNQGIEFKLETSLKKVDKDGDTFTVHCLDGSSHSAHQVMMTTGRRPHTKDLGLEKAGVKTETNGMIVVDPYSKTSVDHIYALGDCTERPQLTPVAIRDAQAFADTVYGGMDVAVDHTLVPTAVFCKPAVGVVGLSEAQAMERGEIDVYQAKFRPMFHTLSGRDEKILMKLVVMQKTQKIVGFHMVGPDAPELAQAVAIAMKMGATKADFDNTIALHPTTAEELVLMRTKRA